MNNIYFEIGDDVYHYVYGQGIVLDTTSKLVGRSYPVWVKFQNNYTEGFTFDGREEEGEPITLSQNPIQLITNTPKNSFKKGELVWVKFLSCSDTWVARYYSHTKDEKHCVFINQTKEGNADCVYEIRKFNEIPF